jgi:hypothetical protein
MAFTEMKYQLAIIDTYLIPICFVFRWVEQREGDMQNWTFLEELAAELATAARHELPEGTSTILSDRIITALGREDRSGLEEAQSALERFYLHRLAAAPPSAAAAARAEADAKPEEEAAFALPRFEEWAARSHDGLGLRSAWSSSLFSRSA